MKAAVDRIEGKKAVLLLGPEEIEVVLPLTALPKGISESSVLSVRFSVDARATRVALDKAKERIESLKRLSRKHQDER